MKADLPRVTLCGVELAAITEARCVEHVVDEIARGHGGWIVTPNLDHLRRLTLDAEYRELCGEADVLVADGMPLLWASRLQGTPLPERVAGSSLISTLTAGLARRGGGRVFLIGGDGSSAAEAARVLVQRHPEIVVCGLDCPWIAGEVDDVTRERLGRRLRWARPDLVYVALGSPKQEKLVRVLRTEYPRAWMVGVGISFGFLSGRVRRAPPWMQRAGLEWLHRLAQEPRRLARRYLVDGLPFALRLLVTSARRAS